MKYADVIGGVFATVLAWNTAQIWLIVSVFVSGLILAVISEYKERQRLKRGG